jgi:hypothetical protein
VLALVAALPVACAAPQPPPPANPFAGAWATAEHHAIAFRDDTVVLNPPDAAPTPMGKDSCDGTFRFGYARMSRGTLLGLAPHQPDLVTKLAPLLLRPNYPVAELTCGEGGTTYVLLGERDIVAIHRDRDIAGIERLARP